MFNTSGSVVSGLLRPGIAEGTYPERDAVSRGRLARVAHALSGLRQNRGSSGNYKDILAAIHDHAADLREISENSLLAEIQTIRQELHAKGLNRASICRSFALIREVAGRHLGMQHYDTQLIGGWILLHGGLAEMETGEGKTLTATLAATTAALAGIPVHIVTTNDYLVQRDADFSRPLYAALGLQTGAAVASLPPTKRRIEYGADITYCTNKQLAFDYLRDQLVQGENKGRLRLHLEKLYKNDPIGNSLFLRGLCFAIIDEADSVLIDEARTPLIISRNKESKDEQETFNQAMRLAALLKPDSDFIVHRQEKRVTLQQEGLERLAKSAGELGGIWSSTRRREELVNQALAAMHLYRRDRDYLVHEGKVLIIDENTGRVMADRSWEGGLHQMIEIKEGCKPSGRKEHMARLTYQRFFRRYLHLAGMSGTAGEVRRELWSIYDLPVFKVQTHKPCLRQNRGIRMYQSKKDKWAAVVATICEMHARKQPLLIGTRSVADSELLSVQLMQKNIPHQVLNARQDAKEAAIIANAGKKGVITIATNMAGRGTDIVLGDGVAKLGGLHVIITEYNEAKRIDRQLYGRCARQGDPGSYEAILSLEDDLLLHSCTSLTLVLLGSRVCQKTAFGKKIGLAVMRLAQLQRERHHKTLRKNLLRMDEQLGKLLAFSGRME